MFACQVIYRDTSASAEGCITLYIFGLHAEQRVEWITAIRQGKRYPAMQYTPILTATSSYNQLPIRQFQIKDIHLLLLAQVNFPSEK